MTIESLAADIVSRLPAMVKDTAINNEALVARLINDWCVLRTGQHWAALKKPEPRLRPWKPEEVPVGALLKEKGEGKSITMILGRDGRGGGVLCWAWGKVGFVPVETLFNDGELYSTDGGKTWKPCGVEVVE